MNPDADRPLILTSGDRPARALREDLHVAERAAGKSVWQTPDVRSLRQWIADAWADSWPTAQLLDGTQMQALWLHAVERDRHAVISATACAREARDAERLAQEYLIDLDKGAAYSEEQRAWRAWRSQIASRMRAHDWISTEHLPTIVATALREGRIRPPAELQLVGFGPGLAPAMRQVLDALGQVGAVCTPRRVGHSAPAIRGFRTTDEAAQMRLVAELIRQRLVARIDDEMPPRIVVVLPDPDARRALLEDALIEVVTPALRLPATDNARPRAPWRWDAAAELSTSPWAAALLAIVAVDAVDNSPESISRLLLGTWGTDGALHAAAAEVDLRLRGAGTLLINIRRLAELARAPLLERVSRLVEVVEHAPRRALPSTWSSHFEARLLAAGWPGLVSLPSAVFQTVQELRRVLAALAALDVQTGPIDAARARLWLGELLKRRFEPRAEHAQPVRILAAEDAAGMACDLLIVIEADAGNFPGPLRTTPFLPIELQRAAGVPQASPSAWLAQRRTDVAALLMGAREIVVVAPRTDARGSEVLASPLFDAEWRDAPAPIVVTLAEQLGAAGTHVYTPPEDRVPPVAAAEHIQGDTRLFEQYVAAPFFAFCTHRLGIEPLPEVGRGLPAQVQGTLVHAALAAFWNGLETRAGLRAMSPPARKSRIEDLLAPLLRRHLPAADYGHVLVRLEAARLVDVLSAWLSLEAAREDDFVVVAHERKLVGSLAGLPLSLRIDRIEKRIDDGTLSLIDYKTGAWLDPNGWREDALAAPQLPLYAVLLGGNGGESEQANIADIAFGHVADGAPELLRWSRWSIARRRQPLRHAGNFAAQREAWRTALEAVAHGFLEGRAGIDAGTATRLRDAPLMALAGLLADEDEAASDMDPTSRTA